MPTTLLVEVKQQVLFFHEWVSIKPSWSVNCDPNLIDKGYAQIVSDELVDVSDASEVEDDFF